MVDKQNEVRTRIAPSPTGFPHIGNIYQSLIDKAFALKHNGKFVLRIEDTDRTRYVPEAEESIFTALEWFGLTPDESPKTPGAYEPYRQSERLEMYIKAVDELIEKNHAYYCFCSKERLDEVRKEMQKEGKPPMYDKYCRDIPLDEARKRIEAGEEYVVRMKVPENGKIVVHDLVRGDIEFDSNTVDDQVILKADGFPTYHLAVVVDDHLMNISHVVRGPEWITSFPKHKLLYDYFGWDMPKFVHTPMISNMDGSKLAKRHGHSSVDWYRERGFLPEAVLNFIALLGWSHPEEKEIFSFDEFVKVFDLKDLSAVSPKLDLVKLEWMNGQYMQELTDEEFIKRLVEWLEYCIDRDVDLSDYEAMLEFVKSLDKEKHLIFAEMNKTRIKKFEDILELNAFFFKDIEIDKDLLTKQKSLDEVKDHLKWFSQELEESDWTLEKLKSIEKKIAEKAKELNWKIGEAFYPIRIAVCKSKISPPLFESIYLIGREEVLKRTKIIFP